MFLTLKEAKQINNHPVSLFSTSEWANWVHTWPFNSCTAGRADTATRANVVFSLCCNFTLFRFDCAVLRRCAYVLVLLSQTWLENVLMRCQDVSSGFTLLNVEPALSDSLMTQPGFERTCGLQKPWMQTFYCSNLPVPPILWNRKQQT